MSDTYKGQEDTRTYPMLHYRPEIATNPDQSIRLPGADDYVVVANGSEVQPDNTGSVVQLGDGTIVWYVRRAESYVSSTSLNRAIKRAEALKSLTELADELADWPDTPSEDPYDGWRGNPFE